MGKTWIWDVQLPILADDLPTFAQGLTVDQRDLRLLLHDLMLENGFAPFYGEWWHFLMEIVNGRPFMAARKRYIVLYI